MRYFITGATGFIGGKLSRRLLSEGHEVSALVRDPEKAAWLEEMGADIHMGDITRRDTLREPMEGADGIFHTAAIYKLGFKDNALMERVNVEGTHNVLEEMKRQGIRKGVYTSTLTVFSDTLGEVKDETFIFRGHHISEYDRTKWEAHYSVARPMMLNQGVPVVIVMPGVVYGPGDTSQMGETFSLYLRRKLPVLPKEPQYCWSHIDDIVQGHIMAMKKGVPGETYIISGPRHSMLEAFETAERITGIKTPRIKLSRGMLMMASRIMKVVGVVASFDPKYHTETLRVSAGATYLGSNEKAKRELGYDPRPLEEGLRETLIERMNELGIKGPSQG